MAKGCSFGLNFARLEMRKSQIAICGTTGASWNWSVDPTVKAYRYVQQRVGSTNQSSNAKQDLFCIHRSRISTSATQKYR